MPRKTNTNNGPAEGAKDSRPKRSKKSDVANVTIADESESGVGKGLESRIAKDNEFRVQHQKTPPKAPDNPKVPFEVISSFKPAGDH
jgi:hypothetical protein